MIPVITSFSFYSFSSCTVQPLFLYGLHNYFVYMVQEHIPHIFHLLYMLCTDTFFHLVYSVFIQWIVYCWTQCQPLRARSRYIPWLNHTGAQGHVHDLFSWAAVVISHCHKILLAPNNPLLLCMNYVWNFLNKVKRKDKDRNREG